ncbi:MAG: hypothetical protein WBO43_09135 [Gemmatimonadota bacterium]
MKRDSGLVRLPFRYLAALLALPGIVGMGRPVAAHGQFSVSPVILPIPHSTEVTEATVMVRNNGESPLQLRIFSADFDQDADGSHSTSAAGTHARSCSGRLEIVPDGLSIPAGVTQPVMFRLRPGGDRDSTCWSLVFIEKPPPEGTGPRAALRIGVKVYGLSADGGESAEISAASVVDGDSTSETGGRELQFTISNPDAWPVLARGTVEIRDLEGLPYGTVAVEAFSVLPEHARTVRVPLEAVLAPGRYLAIPVLEYGDDGLMGAQVAFRVE